jgi:F-type H+-transporting ATPase subunit a
MLTPSLRTWTVCLIATAAIAGWSPVASAEEHEAPTAAAPAAAGHDLAAAEHAGGHDAGHGHAHPEPFTLLSLILGKDGTRDGAVELRGQIEHSLHGTAFEKTLIDKKPFSTDGHVTHVFFAAIAMLLLIGGGLAVRAKLNASPDAGVLPARQFGVLLFFETVVGMVWNMMKGMMGAEEARRHFPLVCTLSFYIFTMNFMALLPLGDPATDNLNTNIVMGLTVFFATHISGLRAQGVVNYAKHFMGPVIALAPLMIIIEIISHCVRPMSLSLRLLGNMYGDHKVMENFLNFHVPLVPLPVMFLGLIVVVVQTVVFTLLSTVYLSMAVAHHDDHDHGHGEGHAHH